MTFHVKRFADKGNIAKGLAVLYSLNLSLLLRSIVERIGQAVLRVNKLPIGAGSSIVSR